MKKLTIHVIPNAHLDPVWIWDWREGLNEGISTCRSMLDLMEANPDLTFIRGEAAIYEHVRRSDPATFARIKTMVRSGRWDVVGGTWIQPDANLLGSETLCRQFETGLRYFREVLGVRVRTAWQPDTFGHTAGLPGVLTAGGIENFAFGRPGNGSGFKLRLPAFWWNGRGGARILTYRAPVGWYNSERYETPRRLDELASWSRKRNFPLRNVAMYLGLGNHGGGPSQRMVDDVHEWAATHPEFEVRFAGLSSFFAALRRELAAPGGPRLDEMHGEVNYCMRGCYASVARFKHTYRRAEQELLRAERTTALLQNAGLAPGSDLSPDWKAILFNSFHDILPGSSIERAFDEQIDEVCGVRHSVRSTTFRALNHLIGQMRVALPAVGYDHPKAVPFLVWNPLLQPVRAFVEIEACLDFRFIKPYENRVRELPMEVRVGGRRAPFQVIAAENESFERLAWRRRVLVPMSLPAAGWNLVSLGWVEGVNAPSHPHSAAGRGQTIRNSFYRVSVRDGADGIEVRHRGRSLFGRRGLHLATVADNWGSWGSFGEVPDSFRLTSGIGRWRISRVAVIESGPLRAAIVVRFTARRAHADLTLRLSAGVEEVAIEARVFTDLEAARIMLVLPGASAVECEVPAERVRRTVKGEIPVLRWLRARDGGHGFAIASDVLSAYNLNAGSLRVTLARATRYARVEDLDRSKEWWRPAVDRGELRERLTLLPVTTPIERVADQLTEPPIVTMAWENPAGTLPAVGSLASLTPPEVRLLALKPGPGGKGLDLRLQNLAKEPLSPVLRLGNRTHRLGRIRPGNIATFRFSANASGSPRRVALGQ